MQSAKEFTGIDRSYCSTLEPQQHSINSLSIVSRYNLSYTPDYACNGQKKGVSGRLKWKTGKSQKKGQMQKPEDCARRQKIIFQKFRISGKTAPEGTPNYLGLFGLFEILHAYTREK